MAGESLSAHGLSRLPDLGTIRVPVVHVQEGDESQVTAAMLSDAKAGLYMLFWQQPSDRALAGWCPSGFDYYARRTDLVRWLTDQVTADSGEIEDRGRVR